jgi:hypothetical protein
MLTHPGAGPRDKLAYGFRRVMSRAPSEAELARLVRLLEGAQADLKAKPEAAANLLKSASAEAVEQHPASELAAYCVAANVLMNLDEALTKP